MIKIEINKENFRQLAVVADFLSKKREKRIEIFLAQNSILPSLSEISPHICDFLDYEKHFRILLRNFPFCALPFEARDHIMPSDGESNELIGEKTSKCKKCFYFKVCFGFPCNYFKIYGTGEVCAIEDLPHEVMLEIEPSCNFNCSFCFNKISFAEKGRNLKKLDNAYLKKVISGIAKAKIKNIRFTGGEPLLRQDIFDLLEFAKEKKLYVLLNTNGSLVNQDIAERLNGLVDNVLIPIESCSDDREFKITCFPHALRRKIEAIDLLRTKGKSDLVIRVGTVISPRLIFDFDKMVKVVSKLPIDEWEFYRPISDFKNKKAENTEDGKDLEILVKKIISCREKGINATIANAIPFCVLNEPGKLNFISKGALFEDGHKRMVMDPRGFMKPHYFYDFKIGDPLDILGSWNHEFMKKMRNFGYLPEQCKLCDFRFKCCGGSRYMAQKTFGKYESSDFMANFLNIRLQ